MYTDKEKTTHDSNETGFQSWAYDFFNSVFLSVKGKE